MNFKTIFENNISEYSDLVAMMIVTTPIAFWKNAPFNHVMVSLMFVIISHIVLMFYIIAAYVILYREKKRNRLPAYIRMTPTSLCMIAGFAVNLLLIEDRPVLPICFALGLLFADYYMYRRLRYIDPETGFFNQDYLPALIVTAKGKQLTGATVIRLKTEHENDVMTEILKSWEPDECKTISMGDGLFLLVSNALADSISNRFLSLVTKHAKNEGIPVDADYATDREGSTAELLKKYVD